MRMSLPSRGIVKFSIPFVIVGILLGGITVNHVLQEFEGRWESYDQRESIKGMGCDELRNYVLEDEDHWQYAKALYDLKCHDSPEDNDDDVRENGNDDVDGDVNL